MKAYIHPTSGATLRSYNRGELKEILKEIEEKNTTPGFKKISANLANAKMTIGSTSNSAAKSSQATTHRESLDHLSRSSCPKTCRLAIPST